MLAIVIPAFKHQFLNETLNSIANQTCKDFNLYIGDDASPNPIGEIVEGFKGKLDFAFKRFDENLGAKSLVGHWNRCIEMTQGEEWIWLFSDDDQMDKSCVELFYREIRIINKPALFRFNKVIQKEKNRIYMEVVHEEKLTDFLEFTKDVLGLTRRPVSMPEFIFHRDLFDEFGIVEFPLAWGSDKATFLKYASKTGEVINLKSKIIFNQSGQNISSQQDSDTLKLKNIAKRQYLDWLYQFIVKQALLNGKIGKEDLNELFDGFVRLQAFLSKKSKVKFKERLLTLSNLLKFVKTKRSLKEVFKVTFFPGL